MLQLRIISRNSQLALWQAEFVKQQLNAIYPDLEISIVGVTTEGDRILDKSLEKIGGKGLFIKELEYQLQAGAADIAVHSLKDLPARLVDGFELAAVLKREDPRDALVSNHYSSLDAIPAGGIIGTSSSRRRALLQRYYPHLEVRLVRGNLQTRLAKLDAGQFSAIILAVAGLKRLGLTQRICQYLALDKFIPAIGQGVLAIEICANRPELVKLLAPIHDQATAAEISAEREMGRFLNASCNLPIAGYAQLDNEELKLDAMVASTKQFIRIQVSGNSSDPIGVGRAAAQCLLDQGAAQILDSFTS